MTFREFVESRRPGDNPRGDAIRDTVRLLKAHPELESFEDLSRFVAGGAREARAEMRKLHSEYLRAVARQPSQ